MAKEYEFKDLTKFSVIEIPEGEEIESFYEGQHTVYGVGKGTWNNDEELYIELLYEDEEYQRGWMEKVAQSHFEEAGCTIVSVPDESTQDTINTLDSLIESMNKQAEEIESKAKQAGLEYDVVVLSSPDDLIDWKSSRC